VPHTRGYNTDDTFDSKFCAIIVCLSIADKQEM